MLTYKFEALCFFENSECVIVIFQADPSVTEEVFFCYIFNRLSNEELRNLKKISICQECDQDDEIFPFINESRGKVFFELTDDSHPIDRRVNEYKNTYLEIMSN